MQKKGLLVTAGITLFLLFVFYGKLMRHPNSVYFGSTGDGLQTYYNTLYHLKYDSSFAHVKAMNYPYGENTLFTSIQPLVPVIISATSWLIDLQDNAVAMVNLFMLLGIVVCAIFLFLIFQESGLPPPIAIPAAVIISFLSPQVQRMGGHYLLSVPFAIPAIIYLLMRFHRKPSLRLTIVTGGTVFLLSLLHLYFFAFAAILIFCFWLVALFRKLHPKFTFSYALTHFLLQTALPYMCLQLITRSANHIDDRTSYPWGLSLFVTKWQGIFYPYGKPYETVVSETVGNPGPVEWEGIAYVGLAAMIMMAVVVFQALRALIIYFKSKRNIFQEFASQPVLVSSVAASIIALVIAFGFPFAFFPETIDYLGPFKQLRGSGRFNWIFFYVANIAGIILAYIWTCKSRKLSMMVCSLLLLVMSVDTFYQIRNQQDLYNNRIEELADKKNELPGNRWVSLINPKEYQAILPLPYFHVGSENVWLNPADHAIIRNAYVASLKTGLPLMAMSASRTSLSQTYENIQLVLEPYRELQLVKKLNKKPLLLLAREESLNQEERSLLSLADEVTRTDHYTLYRLPVERLASRHKDLYHKVSSEAATARGSAGNYFEGDTILPVIRNTFDDNRKEVTYKGKGAYEGKVREYNFIYEGAVPQPSADSSITWSFWMFDFTKDLFPRMTIEVDIMDAEGKIYDVKYIAPKDMLRTLDGPWALCESTFKVKQAGDKIKIAIWSTDIDDAEKVIIDEVMLRPSGTNFYASGTDWVMKNNRYYYRR